MATFEIKMPKLGESITEGTIMSWSVKVGDDISEDDVLFEVSTAKVSAEIPSPVAGKIIELLFKEGDTVAVGTPVAIVALEGSEEVAAPLTVESHEAADKEKEKVAAPVPVVSAPAGKPKKESGRWYSPVVQRIAHDAGIGQEELDSIAGTGFEGRLSKGDLKNYLEHKKQGIPARPDKQPVQAVPKQPVPSVSAIPEISIPSVPVVGDDRVDDMDRVRRIIADHMVMSKKVSPHVTTVVEADVTRLVQWRSRMKDEFHKREGIPLTFMPAITEAVAKALAKFPYVNASVDGYQIILKKRINIGIAVSLNDGNLIVPVIHDADKLNLQGLALSIDSLAAKARANKLSPDLIQGGTFTITNFGSFKSLFGTPVINQPQVAILGVGYIEKKPAVVETPEGDTIAIRHKMYLSLSHDHRIIDGSMAGEFLRCIVDYLEHWNA